MGGAVPRRSSARSQKRWHAPRQPSVKANLSINEMLRRGDPFRPPVIAALRPIRARNDMLAGSFIGDGCHRDKRQDDNPEDQQPKPAPQVDGALGSVRFMTGMGWHGTGPSQLDQIPPTLMA